MSEKHFLFISYYFPPVKVVGAVRLYHLSQELARRDATVSVITCRNRKRFRQDDNLDPCVETIHTAPAWDWRSLRLLWSGNASPFVSPGIKGTWWGRWFSRAQESFPLHFLLGDGGPVYILSAYFLACRHLREQATSHVFTSYRPYADHWIAFLLKRRFPHLFWIADFRDLHIDPIRHNVLWPRLQRWIDGLLLRRANLVTVVSHGLGAHLPVAPQHLHVLPNGIPATPLTPWPQTTGKFTITYTGSIYPGLQKADLLFQALSRLLTTRQIDAERLQLIYMGKDSATWETWMAGSGLAPYSLNRGEQNREAALRQQGSSSINLLLSWSAPRLQGVLTSKVYEYLASCAPILALVNGPPDAELETIVTGTGAGRVFYRETTPAEELELFLQACYAEWEKNGSVRNLCTPEDLRPYTWPAQVDRLLNRCAML